MLLNEILSRVKVASLEIAAGDADWWKKLTPNQKAAYIKKNPGSKYAKNAKAKGLGNPLKPNTEGPKLRGPKAVEEKTKDKPKVDKVNLDKKKKGTIKPEVKKIIKKAGDVPRKKSSMNPKELLKHKLAKIKSLQGRLSVLAAEKTYRNVAKAFTQRQPTKERLAERIKKIGQISKDISDRIKSIEKHVKQLQTNK